jgi:predicted AlkP superfamily pyrophosphatase or phosphodiesterase
MNNVYKVKPVNEGHSKEPENVAFMSSCPLYTVDTVLQWLSQSDRPDLITLYFDEPDHVGHGSGPDSLEVCKLCFI